MTGQGASGSVRPTPKSAGDLPHGLWSTPVTIRFGRCDPAGIVYTPHYFDIFNGVIEAWYVEALEVDYYGLFADRAIGLGYGHASCDFFAPSRMGETLTIAMAIERLGQASVTLTLHAMHDGRERARGRFVSVCTDRRSWKPTPFPSDLRETFMAYRGRSGSPA